MARRAARAGRRLTVYFLSLTLLSAKHTHMGIDVSEAGRRGGRARARRLTAKERSKIARAAALKRWGKERKARPRR